MVGKSSPAAQARGTAPSRIPATLSVVTCSLYLRVATLYVESLIIHSLLHKIPSLHLPTYSPSMNLITNATRASPARSSNGNKTTPASGPSIATSPGTSREVSTPTSWRGLLISKTWSFRRRRTRIVEIGRIIRGRLCCRRLIRGCDGGS